MYEILISIVFVLGYAAIALEHHTKVNKTAAALLTAVVCWTLLALQAAGVPSAPAHGVGEALSGHLQDTAQIVFFLIGAMTIVQLMEMHGGFSVVANLIRTRNKVALLWIISITTFFLSAVLDNLTTAIVMVTLFHRLIDDPEDRLVFASMVIIAANAGGAWSPIGDVTTTMLWIGGRVSAAKIMLLLFLPSLLSMLVPLIWFTTRIKKGALSAVQGEAALPALGAKRVFLLGIGSLMFVPVFKTVTGLPPFIGILLGLGLMWLLTDMIHTPQREHLKAPRALGRIDFESVLFFLGILLAVSALQTAGILGQVAGWMDRAWGNKDLIATALGLLSAIVDNVPLTAATMGMYPVAQYPMDSKLWELLAYAVGTGGSILIIGSAAGVVVMGKARIDFFWYLKKVSLPALAGYLAGVGAYLLLYRLVS